MKLAGLLLILSVNSIAADLGTDTNYKPVAGSITLWGHDFVLPEGNWTQVAYKDDFSQSGEIPFKNLVLIDTDSKGIKQEYRIRISHSPHNPKNWNDELCKRTNLYWQRSINNGVWEQYCVSVNHISWQFNDQNSDFSAQRARYLIDKGLIQDRVTIRVEVTGYKKGDFIKVSYDIDPERFGISTKFTNWTLSDWHKDRVAKFPEKKDFLDKVVSFAERFHPQYYTYLYGKQPDGPPSPSPLKFE